MLSASCLHIKYKFSGVKYIATLLITLIFFSKGISQSFPYTFQTWDVTNGLSSNYCNAIAQDDDGYLYVGTNNGLYIFNGNNFKSLTRDRDSLGIGEDNVEDIVIDNQHRIWFASIENGVGLIDPDEHNFRIRYFKPKYQPDRNVNDLLQNTKVSRLCFDNKGYLWVGTRGHGLFKLDTTTKEFIPVATNNNNSLYNTYIRSLFLYKSDTLFVGLINGLSMVNPQTNSATHIKFKNTETQKNINPTVRKVLPWNADSFLLATDRGTFWLKLSSGELSSLYKNNATGIDFTNIASNNILKLSENEIWIATENEGIIFLNLQSKQFDYSHKLSEYVTSIPRGLISRFYKDALGNIWIAQQNGFSLFQSYNIQFKGFSFKAKDPFKGALLAINNNLVCFNSHSISSINTVTGNILSKKIIATKKADVVPSYAMAVTKDDYMMFFFDSIFSVNCKTLRSQYLPIIKTQVDSNYFKHFRIMQCIPDTINGVREYLLFARVSKGAILLNYFPDSGLLTEFTPQGFKKEDFNYGYTNIIKAGNGKYWISSLSQGIIYTEKNGGSVQYAATVEQGNRKIPPGGISDFTIGSDGKIWLLIDKTGLVHLTPNCNGAICYELYDESNGLLDKRLYNLIADANGNIWLTNNSGLFCFRVAQKEFFKYSAANGLGNIKFQINEVMLVKTSNGYIGLSDKYANMLWFKPEDTYRNTNPNLILHSLKINDSTINLKTANPQLKLLPDQNNLLFQYDVIDFDKTTFYKILYKLDNFDNRWYIGNNNNEQRYTQLPAGAYTFKIKIQHADGRYSSEKSVSLIIETVWYKTWWFRSIIVLIILGLTYLIIKSYINRRLYEQKKELELSNAVAIERARISTELHDDLGSGLSTIRILSQDNNFVNKPTNSPTNLEKISSHSKDLLQKMTEIVWALNNENDTLDQLVSYIRLQSATQLDNASISYQFNIPELIPSSIITGSNRRHIQLSVKEAVHNIVKHAKASQVIISIDVRDDDLMIKIHDNGIGLKEKDMEKIASNGMHNMKKHIKAVQGTMSVENGIGLTIIFTIPIQPLSHESVI